MEACMASVTEFTDKGGAWMTLVFLFCCRGKRPRLRVGEGRREETATLDTLAAERCG